MFITQFNRYIWLVDTIRSAGRITKEEIDRRWSHSMHNDLHETQIPERTFYRCLNAIEELFDIEIKCDRRSAQYYIAKQTTHSPTKQWLLSQFAVSQSQDAVRELEDRVLYEPIPGGSEYLTTIVDAMRFNHWMQVVHKRFDSTEEPHCFRLAPYCLKVFKQRWYVLGQGCEQDGTLIDDGAPRIYALDRMLEMTPTDDTFQLPTDFQSQDYFVHWYGVFRGKQYQPEFIRARFVPKAAPFVRSLPLHHSQTEIAPCVFEWYVAPTLDFIQQLRTFGAELEVLEPENLREQFKKELRNALFLYN